MSALVLAFLRRNWASVIVFLAVAGALYWAEAGWSLAAKRKADLETQSLVLASRDAEIAALQRSAQLASDMRVIAEEARRTREYVLQERLAVHDALQAAAGADQPVPPDVWHRFRDAYERLRQRQADAGDIGLRGTAAFAAIP